jgi:hypothetical protein
VDNPTSRGTPIPPERSSQHSRRPSSEVCAKSEPIKGFNYIGRWQKQASSRERPLRGANSPFGARPPGGANARLRGGRTSGGGHLVGLRRRFEEFVFGRLDVRAELHAPESGVVDLALGSQRALFSGSMPPHAIQLTRPLYLLDDRSAPHPHQPKGLAAAQEGATEARIELRLPIRNGRPRSSRSTPSVASSSEASAGQQDRAGTALAH